MWMAASGNWPSSWDWSKEEKMTGITLICRGASARARVEGTITQGMVGIPVRLECDQAWQGLRRLLKARCADVVRTVEAAEDTVVLPYECLLAGQRLDIGLDGWDDTGELRIPSGWACCGLVQPSVADCDGEPGALPVPPADTVNAIYERMETTERAVEALSQRVEELPVSDVTEQTVSGWGFTKNTGTYVKPASGIPETDLSAEVQEKLNNAPTLEDVPGNLVLYEATDSSEEEQTIEALMLDKLTLEADGTYIYLKFGQTVLGMVEAGSGGAETIYCTDIVIDQESMTVSMGSTGENTLTATVSPSDCTQLVRWSSSDPSVVTVSSAGVLTVVGVGTATITAKCGTKSASITVTVVDNRKTFNIVSGGIVAEGTVATFDPRGDRASISPMLLYVGARNTVKVTCTSMDFYYGPSGWLVSGSNEDLTGPTVSTSGRILDAGWQQGEYTGTISGWTHLSINAKKSNGTSFTDADLTTLQNALRIEVE